MLRARLSRSDRQSMKSRAAFLVGCMAGCFLSTAFYIWCSGLLMVSGRYQVQQTAVLPPSLQPSGGFSSRPADRPWTLASELRSKKRLLVAVLTGRTRLNETVAALQKTWATASSSPSVDYAIFVAGEGPSTPRVYWLHRMGDFRDGDGHLRQIFHVLHYLHSGFVRNYHWFMVASQDTYVAVGDVEEMLSGLDASKPVYMGRLASKDPDVMATLRLLPNEYFCEWGPGVVLSNAALVSIAGHLESCKRLAATFGSNSRHQGLRLGRGDVELGRCFSRRIGIQCTSSHEAESYFVSDPDGYSRSSERLWYSTQFQSLLTLHPVTGPQHLLSVHHFVQARALRRLRHQLSLTASQTDQICSQLSPEFSAPFTEPDARSCRLETSTNCSFSPTVDPDIVTQGLPPSFKALNRFEVVPWSLMTPVGVYRSTTTTPVFRVGGELREEINFILEKVISAVNLREAAQWVFWKLVGCHLRYSGTRGREYLLDVVLEERRERSRKRRRWRVLRPHGPGLVMEEDSGEEALGSKVNVLVPLSKVGERFHEFLRGYEREVLREKQNVALVLAVSGPEVEAVNQTMARYQDRHPDAEFTIISSEGAFTRSLALDAAMAQLEDSELAFVCDVDMTFDPSFLDRCRLNARQDSRVYYPEFFKYYDMNYVYRFKRRPAELTIKREHGHWASYSYGMVCIYKSDYLASGGFDTGITGWGGEDVDLFERVLRTGVDVLKAPDPSLRHRYHEKTCSLSLNPDQFAMCVSSRNEGLADRMQLAEYIYYLEDQCGIRDRPLWS